MGRIRFAHLAEIAQLLKRILRLWLTYIRGQLIVSLILGGVTWGLGLALGLAWAFWVGLMTGILSMIPGLGGPLALGLGTGVALWQGSSVLPVSNWAFALIVLGVCFALQQLSNLFLEPRVLGKSLDLPPWLVLVGVLVGAILAQVVGAYLAPPLIATAREIARFVWRKAHRQAPFPQDEAIVARQGDVSAA